MDIYAIVLNVIKTDLVASGVILNPLGVTQDRLRAYFDVALAGLTGRQVQAKYQYIDFLESTTSANTDEEAETMWFEKVYAELS